MAENLAQHLRLMLVTDDLALGRRDPLEVCRAAVRGGVTCIQLRLKHAAPRVLLDIARVLVAGLEVPVVVNDRADVALAAGAGVHLGPQDLPLDLARRLFPAGRLIGASVGTPEEAASAQAADYWGIGPWRTTGTKTDAGPALGAEGFRRLVALSRGKPCLAIGGVRPEDVGEILASGGTGVAVVSGILGQEDVEAAARAYTTELLMVFRRSGPSGAPGRSRPDAPRWFG
ncbi:MAG: thiamine phosphate synthase [Gemmatimonadales bacterium]